MTTSSPDLERRKRWQTRPDESPVMFQSWQKLLFLHWRYDPEIIQKILPRGLTVDTFDGSAWVAIVPFLMRNIRPAWSPVVPYVSNFLELNVRTYAYDENGTPGVWFLSLSANRGLAVWAARTFFHLPYQWSKISATIDKHENIDYTCRQFRDANKQTARYQYRPLGEPAPASDESLEFFLAERYILFTDLGHGKIATGQVHHTPYQVQPVEVLKLSEIPLTLDGLPAPNRPPDHVLYSEGVDVEVFGLKK